MATADLDITMDAASLYREEIYTDRRIGTIRALVPVDPNGVTDAARAVVYMGEAQIMTQMGPLPVSFEIEAKSLGDAVTGYAEADLVYVAASGPGTLERPVEQGQRWFVELKRRGVPAELLLFPGEGHELSRSGRPSHRKARFEHVLHDSFEADRRRTLAVVCFPLGTWVGGMFTTSCLRHLAVKGYPLTLVLPESMSEEMSLRPSNPEKSRLRSRALKSISFPRVSCNW